jgi:ribosomal protein L44E
VLLKGLEYIMKKIKYIFSKSGRGAEYHCICPYCKGKTINSLNRSDKGLNDLEIEAIKRVTRVFGGYLGFGQVFKSGGRFEKLLTSKEGYVWLNIGFNCVSCNGVFILYILRDNIYNIFKSVINKICPQENINLFL